MNASSDTAVALANHVMRAVIASGAVTDGKIDLAVAVMRREVKAFLFEPRYADERELALGGRQALALASVVATCVAEIAAG